MGTLEDNSKRRARKANLKKIIIQSIALAGVLSVAAVAPNVVVAFDKLGLIPGKGFAWNVKRSRERLVDDGLLCYQGRFIKLTKKGQKVLRHLELSDFSLKKPKRWDGKWRVLIFDIPEIKRGLRDKIRRTLIYIGFVRLQNSVWVYPYDCEDLITLLKADFGIGKDVLYLIVDSLEYDKWLRKDFGLRIT